MPLLRTVRCRKTPMAARNITTAYRQLLLWRYGAMYKINLRCCAYTPLLYAQRTYLVSLRAAYLERDFALRAARAAPLSRILLPDAFTSFAYAPRHIIAQRHTRFITRARLRRYATTAALPIAIVCAHCAPTHHVLYMDFAYCCRRRTSCCVRAGAARGRTPRRGIERAVTARSDTIIRRVSTRVTRQRSCAAPHHHHLCDAFSFTHCGTRADCRPGATHPYGY